MNVGTGDRLPQVAPVHGAAKRARHDVGPEDLRQLYTKLAAQAQIEGLIPDRRLVREVRARGGKGQRRGEQNEVTTVIEGAKVRAQDPGRPGRESVLVALCGERAAERDADPGLKHEAVRRQIGERRERRIAQLIGAQRIAETEPRRSIEAAQPDCPTRTRRFVVLL